MIRIKNQKQMELFDPWASLSPKRRKILGNSWPGLFQSEILPELPVKELSSHFENGFGRPTKELYSILGALLLQQQLDLTDEETCNQYSYNIQWHYALNISDESDSAKYLSPKTLWNMRSIATENNLDSIMFDNIAIKLASVFDVDTDSQRIDSVHIKSNMRRLGRIGIFSQTIHKFLINLKRHHRDLFDSICNPLLERYISKKALSAFSLVKPSESSKTLQVVSADLFDLIEQFKDHRAVCSMQSYKLMERVLKEQCNVQADGTSRKITVKEPKQISSDSLQNPSDPDSTFSSHKGQGYQVQIMETFSTTEDKEEKEQTLNLITHVALEKACEHDSHALMPAIEDTQTHGLEPKSVLADTLYGGDNNEQAAQNEQVDLVAPTFKGGNSTGIDLSHFTFDDNGYVTGCPVGHRPVKVRLKKRTNRYNARFELNQCPECPHVDKCPTQPGKKNYYLRYTAKDQRLATRRIFENSEKFIDIYRWRAGVEATMSQYNAQTGVKNLRVRGFKAVRFCAVLKAAGLNLLRAAAVRRARMRAHLVPKGSRLYFLEPFPSVKERICKFLLGPGNLLSPRLCAADYYIKFAA